MPSIVEPLRNTVRLFAAQFAPSVIVTVVPNVGDAGKVTLNGPPAVEIIY